MVYVCVTERGMFADLPPWTISSLKVKICRVGIYYDTCSYLLHFTRSVNDCHMCGCVYKLIKPFSFFQTYEDAVERITL